MNHLLPSPAARKSARFNFRQLCLTGLLLLSVLGANAQTDWTELNQPNKPLYDITYGAGKYVTIGDESVIQVSTDGIYWAPQTSGVPTGKILSKIVYANGLFVVAGHGLVLTSPDGLTWTPRTTGTTSLLLGLTYGGGKFVAVGQKGTIISSPDGITWTTQVSGTTTEFLGITYGVDKFVAVGADGLIKTSPDGLTWTTRTSGTSGRIADITAGSNGSFVAVGPFSVILTSTNGIAWTLLPLLPGSDYVFLTSVTYNPVMSLYVAVSYSNSRLITSTDGTNWTIRASGTQSDLYGVRYLNGQFTAVGEYGSIRSSADGLNWKALTIDRYTTFYATAYGNGNYVAVGNYQTDKTNNAKSIDVAATSADGISYRPGTTQPVGGAGGGFYDITFGNGLFVAVGGDAKIQTSVDGKAWVNRYSNLFQTLNGVAYGGGRFVAVGAGLTARSTDGITWTDKFTQSANLYSGITYAQSQFVAVGYQGSIGTSTDGAVWTARTSGTTKQLTSIVYGNGTYVACGLGGIAIKSVDGVTWTAIPSFTVSDINHITFGNGQFVTVGEDGEIFTSVDGVVWVNRPLYASTLKGVAHGNGQFVAVGLYATIATSPDAGIAPPPSGNFAIMDVTTVSCVPVAGEPNRRSLTFTPQYSGTNGQPISFSVANEMVPNTAPGPYTLGVYIDNPTITLKATQSGTAGEVSFAYNWLAACGNNPPPPPPPSTNFAITGVTTVNCLPVAGESNRRSLTFTPQYGGTNGQPISFSVANEMVPNTAPGPYTLGVYIDNPTITLKATQSGTAGEVSFAYNWLAACGNGSARRGAEPEIELAVRVLGNPVRNLVAVEVTGAEGKTLRLSLTDLAGHVVGQQQAGQDHQTDRYEFDVSTQPAGQLLLRVSTEGQSRTVRILKNE